MQSSTSVTLDVWPGFRDALPCFRTVVLKSEANRCSDVDSYRPQLSRVARLRTDVPGQLGQLRLAVDPVSMPGQSRFRTALPGFRAAVPGFRTAVLKSAAAIVTFIGTCASQPMQLWLLQTSGIRPADGTLLRQCSDIVDPLCLAWLSCCCAWLSCCSTWLSNCCSEVSSCNGHLYRHMRNVIFDFLSFVNLATLSRPSSS